MTPLGFAITAYGCALAGVVAIMTGHDTSADLFYVAAAVALVASAVEATP